MLASAVLREGLAVRATAAGWLFAGPSSSRIDELSIVVSFFAGRRLQPIARHFMRCLLEEFDNVGDGLPARSRPGFRRPYLPALFKQRHVGHVD